MVGGVKLGTTFVVENGLGGVAEVAEVGLLVWLALKLLKIPRNVARAVRAASASGNFLVMVHAPGGSRMMRAAMGAAVGVVDAGGKPRLRIVAATLPTDPEDEEAGTLGMAGSAGKQAFRRADLTRRGGLDGAWTSARDLAALRARLGPDFLLVVPGIRPVWFRTDDWTHIVAPTIWLSAGRSPRPMIRASPRRELPKKWPWRSGRLRPPWRSR